MRDFIVMNFLFGDAARMPGHADSLLESGLVDSTGVLEIVDFLETDMGIVVADDETLPTNLDSVDNLTDFVLRKRSTASVA
ncbi:MAG: acyl carrier protein [Nocardioides sp.]|uniref:acyl carrier protein n=1 Tax=Nocardioides sp. TaxID=35761 RepID=UPI003F0D2477